MVDQVSLVGSGKDKGFRQANIKLRFNRNPMIGAAPGGLLRSSAQFQPLRAHLCAAARCRGGSIRDMAPRFTAQGYGGLGAQGPKRAGA